MLALCVWASAQSTLQIISRIAQCKLLIGHGIHNAMLALQVRRHIPGAVLALPVSPSYVLSRGSLSSAGAV